MMIFPPPIRARASARACAPSGLLARIALLGLACSPASALARSAAPAPGMPPAPPGPSAAAPSAGQSPLPPGQPAQRAPLPEPFNVLLFVLDDLGVEQLAIYDELNGWSPGYPYAPTPNIDALAAEGVTFTRFHATPVCSPFRASVLTGQRVHKHRLGAAVNAGTPADLRHVEGKLLTALLEESPHPVALAHRGKWHLGPGDDDPGHPQHVGLFHTYSGKLENPNVGPQLNGSSQGWLNYRYTQVDVQGEVTQVDIEAWPHLQVVAYEPMRAFAAAHAGPGSSFFAFNAFHFAHVPLNGAWLDPSIYTDPVTGFPFHGYGPQPPLGQLEAVGVVRMMTESADTMIGGVLQQLSPEQRARTVVILCADNGTDGVALSPEYSPSLSEHSTGVYDPQRFKHTLYQGGIRVPLVIWGGSETGILSGVVRDALCEASDLHATIAEAFGLLGSMDPLADGVSLWPILLGEASEVRSYAFSQFHTPNGATASTYVVRRSAVVNQDRWKLIDRDGVEELYDLVADPFELQDLLGAPGLAQLQYADLRAELDRIQAEAP